MFWFVTCLPFVAYITYAILTPRSGPFWKSVLPSYEHPNWSANAKSNGRTWHAKSNRSWGNWAETPNPHESSMNPKFLYSNGQSRGINRISLNLPIKLLCLKILIGCWNYFEGQDGSSFFFFNGDPWVKKSVNGRFHSEDINNLSLLISVPGLPEATVAIIVHEDQQVVCFSCSCTKWREIA